MLTRIVRCIAARVVLTSSELGRCRGVLGGRSVGHLKLRPALFPTSLLRRTPPTIITIERGSRLPTFHLIFHQRARVSRTLYMLPRYPFPVEEPFSCCSHLLPCR